LKCSVCAKEVPAEEYAAHLAAEHDVTDDPGAVLLEHLGADYSAWDVRGSAPEDRAVALPPGGEAPGGHTRRGPWVALLVVLVLIGAAVGYAVTRGGGSKPVATTRVAPTTTTTVSVTTTVADISAGPPQSQVPVTSAAPTTLGTGIGTGTGTGSGTATTSPATAGDPASKLQFAYQGFKPCAGGDSTEVNGSVHNGNLGAYSFTFTVNVVRAPNTVVATATGAVNHLAPGGTASFTATGPCYQPVAPSDRPQTRVDSITPG
jgi:hypothetical protein